MNVDELASRVDSLETRLIEQDHRIIATWRQFTRRKTEFPDPKDPRRLAAAQAFFLCLFFSPTAIAAGGGLLTVTTFLLLSWQTRIMQEANELVRTSNEMVEASYRDDLTVLIPSTTYSHVLSEDIPGDEQLKDVLKTLKVPAVFLSRGNRPHVFVRVDAVVDSFDFRHAGREIATRRMGVDLSTADVGQGDFRAIPARDVSEAVSEIFLLEDAGDSKAPQHVEERLEHIHTNFSMTTELAIVTLRYVVHTLDAKELSAVVSFAVAVNKSDSSSFSMRSKSVAQGPELPTVRVDISPRHFGHVSAGKFTETAKQLEASLSTFNFIEQFEL